MKPQKTTIALLLALTLLPLGSTNASARERYNRQDFNRTFKHSENATICRTCGPRTSKELYEGLRWYYSTTPWKGVPGLNQRLHGKPNYGPAY